MLSKCFHRKCPVKEANFITSVAYDFFGVSNKWSAGLWAYGFTDFPKTPNLKKMHGTFDEFNKELAKMDFFDTNNYLTTKK